MILSEKLTTEVNALLPETKELSEAEVIAIATIHEKQSRLGRDLFFSQKDGLQYNSAAENENSRWSIVGSLPLLVTWSVSKIEKNIVTFTSSILFSQADKGYESYLTRFWHQSTQVKFLPEEVLSLPACPWLPNSRELPFLCLASEYSGLVTPFVMELLKLQPVPFI